MSAAAQSWAYRQNAGGPTAKLVLLLIADQMGAGGCSLSLTHGWAVIAEVSEEVVLETCRDLVELGLCVLEDGGATIRTVGGF